MPAMINLKFKGNKSFVPFSNLSDTDSLTKTWKVCTKVATFLEQGQRLENLSWRLWHLQNLIVDTDNAKSKREFKKLSKHMGDKLDKEKGRSIEELEAPGFKRNHSTELIQQRAIEKERNREASLNSRPGTITRMQFTFSVDQPTPANMSGPVQKPDLKPSMEFNKRGRRAAVPNHVDKAAHEANNDKDPPLTQRGRKPTTTKKGNVPDRSSSPSLRFPSLFTNDCDPHALLHPTPARINAASYGEGVPMNTYNPSDGFSVMRPTIELPLDELLTNAESPGPWSSTASDHEDNDHDVEMKPGPLYSIETFNERHDTPTIPSPFANIAPLTPLSPAVEELPSISASSTCNKSNKRPLLSVKTSQTSTRSSTVASATLTSLSLPTTNNSAPGGVKAECSNCGATHTPLWRRGLNDELNCNACGLYCKLHKRPRPKNMRNAQGEGRTQIPPRQEPPEVVVSAQCYNCHTTATPLWRKDDEGKTVCNACGLYYKLHGAARPISMKSDVIRKRSRHDAGRRISNAHETPSASPGVSRRGSPEAVSSQQPTLAPDSTTQISYNSDNEYRPQSQSELMGALGPDHGNPSLFSAQTSYSSSLGLHPFPGPYHPDYLSQNYSSQDSVPFSGDDSSDVDSSDCRSNKRRRMSTDSASEPPSSAVSYSSYAESYSTGQTSATSHSPRSSTDFPYNNYSSYGLLRGPSSTLWHPPMLPPDNSPRFIHPPMLPSEEPSMDFLHPPALPHDDDALFATYLHPPMILPDSPPVPMSSLNIQPTMNHREFSKQESATYYENNSNNNNNNNNNNNSKHGVQSY